MVRSVGSCDQSWELAFGGWVGRWVESNDAVKDEGCLVGSTAGTAHQMDGRAEALFRAAAIETQNTHAPLGV